MHDKIDELFSQASKELLEINDLRKLEEWRINYLGKKSFLVDVIRNISQLSQEERRAVGSKVNSVKQQLESSYIERKEVIQQLLLESKKEKIDVTLPGRATKLGRLHPVTQALNEVCEVFVNMGFQIAEGPEVEWEYYNFEALNMPKEHPARDAFATLWISQSNQRDGILLRTHTSPVQIRVMENNKPPIRVIAPGRVYRYEATDATHEWMFHQVEGLAVDTGITMSDLKGTLFEFAKRLFGKERKARFRCDYFPFVEPGVELAIDCFLCNGSGCRICKNTGWIEILGAGMVHPEVLRRCNIDPKVYSGFAFGMGVERIVMLRYGIEDIRYFFANDLRFLNQF